jgi:hypothetical protein
VSKIWRMAMSFKPQRGEATSESSTFGSKVQVFPTRDPSTLRHAWAVAEYIAEPTLAPPCRRPSNWLSLISAGFAPTPYV